MAALIALLHADRQGRAWRVEFNGEIVVVGSQDPEFELARVLLPRGLTGGVKLLDGKTAMHRSTIIDIVKAAGFRTEEGPHGPRFVKRRERRVDDSPAAEMALPDAEEGGPDAQAA